MKNAAFAFVDGESTTVGNVLDLLIAGKRLEALGVIFQIDVYDTWGEKLNVYKLCTQEIGDIKYFTEVNLDDFIRLFEGQDISIIGG